MEIKRNDDNEFSFSNILLTFQFVVIVGFVAIVCYCYLPEIVTWFDWFSVFLRNIFFVFLFANALVAVIYVIYLCKTPEKKELDLYDQYIAAAPTVVHPSPEDCFNGTDVRVYDNGYYHNSGCNDTVPGFQAVETVMESHSYDRVAMEVNSKSYRKTRSEKKTEKKARMVEYRRTESEKVTKTASWRSQKMEGMSNEEFRMTVETFIMEKKRMRLQQYGVADQLQNGVAGQWQNGVAGQWQNGVADQWLPEQENDALPWQNGVPQLQNGVVQWQGLSHDDGTGRRRSRRLVGGSGSTGSGSYLAISN